jgi:hypothetical protein
MPLPERDEFDNSGGCFRDRQRKLVEGTILLYQ